MDKTHQKKYQNLAGQTFGLLEILEEDISKTDNHESIYWKCRCKICGNIVSLKRSNIITRIKTNNPCNKCSRKDIKCKYRDLVGQKFNKLTVIKRDTETSKTGCPKYWIVQCDCGSPPYSIRSTSLTSSTARRQQCQLCSQQKGTKQNLINKKFGKLTVVKLIERSIGVSWLCRCECGNEKEYITAELTRKNGVKQCRQCSNQSRRTGYEEITGSQWSKIKKGAIKRNIAFDITLEYIWQLFLNQGRKCAYTHIELKFGKNYNRNSADTTASLDRIDSNKGYIEGNVQWVHKNVNIMKQSLSHKEFISVCNLIANNHPITENITVFHGR